MADGMGLTMVRLFSSSPEELVRAAEWGGCKKHQQYYQQ